MVESESTGRLDDIFKAASDPTRRAILVLLAQHGPTRVTDLAARFDVSLNAVSKHIKVLERAGLVQRRTEWREHRIEVRLEALSQIDAWFDELRSIWAMRLEALDKLLTKEAEEMTDLTLTTERTIAAPPEKVFDAWLDADMLARFMTPGPDVSVTRAATDAKVGGRFEIIMQAGDKAIPHAGTYLEIDRPARLEFTWESPFSVDGSTVTVTFAPVGSGTHVTLTHVVFPSEESRDNHRAGWTAILAALETAVA